MNNTPEFADLTMDELAMHSAYGSTIGVQEERIRRALASKNVGAARSILSLVEGWTATTEEDIQRLEDLIYGQREAAAQEPAEETV